MDFTKYVKNKDSIYWKIKHNLVLDHISRKVIRDSFVPASVTTEEKRSNILDFFAGVMDSIAKKDSTDMSNLDSDTIMGMTDEQRMDLYNKIIDMVGELNADNEH